MCVQRLPCGGMLAGRGYREWCASLTHSVAAVRPGGAITGHFALLSYSAFGLTLYVLYCRSGPVSEAPRRVPAAGRYVRTPLCTPWPRVGLLCTPWPRGGLLSARRVTVGCFGRAGFCFCVRVYYYARFLRSSPRSGRRVRSLARCPEASFGRRAFARR